MGVRKRGVGITRNHFTKKRKNECTISSTRVDEPRGNNGTSRVSFARARASLKRCRRSRAAASDAPRGHAPCGRPPPRAPPRRCPRARRLRPKRPSGTRGKSGRASPRPSPPKILPGRPPRRPSQRPRGSRTVRRASFPCPSSAASRAPRRPYSAASPGASPRRGNTPPPADASCASRCRSRRECRRVFFRCCVFFPVASRTLNADFFNSRLNPDARPSHHRTPNGFFFSPLDAFSFGVSGHESRPIATRLRHRPRRGERGHACRDAVVPRPRAR